MYTLPPTSTMYAALLQRDSTFEGVFFVGVKTTGIFCRPTCPARKPKPENVEYFASAPEALYAGYRPCSRCNPLARTNQRPELVARLCAAIEDEPERRISGYDLIDMGIDPSTARRQFQRYYGMTFHAYQRARRMGLALHDIREGQPVIIAQQNQGFSSASGFWQTFKQIFGAPPSQAEQVNLLLARWIDTPLGAMLALANTGGLALLEFVDRRGLENEILALRKRTGCFIVPGEHAYLDQIEGDLQRYFSGEDLRFTTPVALNGTPFEEEVWRALQTIEPGETWSYLRLAESLGRPSATRAVGRANGKNMLSLIVPCHRVIGADGQLTGYGGGLWRKQWLLDHEHQAGDMKI